MLDLFSQSALVFLVILVVAYARLARALSHSGGVPRVGKPGVFGYLQTAFRWILDAEGVIAEGKEHFSGKPFVIPTLSGPQFLLGPEYLERLRTAPESVFSQVIAINEALQLPYTMDEHQLSNPYQARVLRTDVSRAIPSYIPEILEESVLVVAETFGNPNQEDTAGIVVFDTMTHLIARITNRVIFGKELCRNEKFLHSVVRFAETTPLMAPFISWSPLAFRPLVYFILSSILGGKKAPLKFIIPYLNRYMADRKNMTEKPGLISEHLIQCAPPDETVEGIAIRLLNIEFGSIHTSSIFITQTLFEIALLSAKDVEGMRAEVNEALEAEGGWTKGALDKFHKIDSALREVGRCYGLGFVALNRAAAVGYDLGDGTNIPPGYPAAVDITAVHFDPNVYPDPNRCDVFRFSKLRAKDGSDTSKLAFSTLDSHYLPFGAGRHACAGRFFAAMQLKMMLGHLLLEYDISYPPTITQRPKNLILNGAVVPDPKARLIFTPRAIKKLS